MKLRGPLRLGMCWIFVSGLLFTSCGGKEEFKYLVGFSQCNLAEPWRQTMNAAVEREAENHPDLHIVYADAHSRAVRCQASSHTPLVTVRYNPV